MKTQQPILIDEGRFTSPFSMPYLNQYIKVNNKIILMTYLIHQ